MPDPEKEDEIGAPKELDLDWEPHPTEEDAQVYSFKAIWHGVLPSQVLRVVILCRPHLAGASSAKKRKRYLEVFFTTDLQLSAKQILKECRGRWSIGILIWGGGKPRPRERPLPRDQNDCGHQ